ncbi:MAG TPA: hypothetical protein VL974_01610 [Magnetospirillum sp.]|jgi:hypothetical protein|nr:hypothetical protein [Magnetospirillum sp.]
MRRTSTAILAAISLVTWLPSAQASSKGGGGEKKELPPSIAVQHADLLPPSIISDRIDGLKITITQVMYPGVPDRAACRFIVRAYNGSRNTVSAHALLRTLDGDKAEINTWMVPTGSLAPGDSSEKLYSCRNAQYLVIDKQALSSWPGRCFVNGEERSPCPLTVALDANLNIVAKD